MEADGPEVPSSSPSPQEGESAPRPLEGMGVAVTREEGGDGPLTTLLRDRGARVLHWGSIGFTGPEDPGPLESALERLGSFHWICFSSPRAVEAVVGRVDRPPQGVKTAAVGPSTARALREAGWSVDRVPEDARGVGLVEAFRTAGDSEGRRVLFPASAIARDTIPRGLASLGAAVEQVTAYRTETLPVDGTACLRSVEEGEVQIVTFTSPSAMAGLRAGIGDELFLRMARTLSAAAMGPTTAEALRKAGWRTLVVAREASLEGLALAAVEAASSRGTPP